MIQDLLSGILTTCIIVQPLLQPHQRKNTAVKVVFGVWIRITQPRCVISAPPPAPPVQPETNVAKVALEGLYVQATGQEYSRPVPIRDREMGALEVFFEAMHGGMG